MKMVVENEEVEKKTSKAGNVYWVQNCWLKGEFLAGRYVHRAFEESKILPPGEYELDIEKSIALNQYGDLEFARRLEWLPGKRATISAMGKTG